MWLASIKLDCTALHRWWDAGPNWNRRLRAPLGRIGYYAHQIFILLIISEYTMFLS